MTFSKRFSCYPEIGDYVVRQAEHARSLFSLR
jgi:hypothetical protein